MLRFAGILAVLLLALPAAADTGIVAPRYIVRLDGPAYNVPPFSAGAGESPDTKQLVALDRYLRWRGVVSEEGTPFIGLSGLPTMAYYVDGARQPGILHTRGVDLEIEIVQFPDAERAKQFDPVRHTQFGHDPVDVGPGELERYITFHTQSCRQDNLVMFVQMPYAEGLPPEDVASLRRAKDRLIAAFTDDAWPWQDMASVAAQEEERLREWQQELWRLRDCGLAQPADAARIPQRERDELRGELHAALIHCRQLMSELEVALDALNADEPWRVPVAVTGMDAVRLLASRADSDAYLADRRTIEFAAIDALFTVPAAALPDTTDVEPAILAALAADTELQRTWQRHHPLPPRFTGLRVFGTLAGITVCRNAAESVPMCRPPGRDHSRCREEEPRHPVLTHLCNGQPPPPPQPLPEWELALFLRRTEDGWIIRKGVMRDEVPWP